MKDKPEVLTEWLVNDDIESLSYLIADLLIKSNYQIIETYHKQWNKDETIVWVLDEGVAFIRSYNGKEKIFLELSSFNHTKHLQFVILLKNMILQGHKNILD